MLYRPILCIFVFELEQIFAHKVSSLSSLHDSAYKGFVRIFVPCGNYIIIIITQPIFCRDDYILHLHALQDIDYRHYFKVALYTIMLIAGVDSYVEPISVHSHFIVYVIVIMSFVIITSCDVISHSLYIM